MVVELSVIRSRRETLFAGVPAARLSPLRGESVVASEW